MIDCLSNNVKEKPVITYFQTFSIIADLILIVHFAIVAFITLGFFFIPIGYKFKWHLTYNKRLRFTHLTLMGLITTESLIGLTCPLTTIEKVLRNNFHSKSFIDYWISKIIYWEIPSIFFMFIYSLCFFYTFLLWKIYPPVNKFCFEKN